MISIGWVIGIFVLAFIVGVWCGLCCPDDAAKVAIKRNENYEIEFVRLRRTNASLIKMLRKIGEKCSAAAEVETFRHVD